MSSACAWRPGAAWGLGGLLVGPLLFASVLVGMAGAVLPPAFQACAKVARRCRRATDSLTRLGVFVRALSTFASAVTGPRESGALTRAAHTWRCLAASVILATVTSAAVLAGQDAPSGNVPPPGPGPTPPSPPTQVQVLQECLNAFTAQNGKMFLNATDEFVAASTYFLAFARDINPVIS